MRCEKKEIILPNFLNSNLDDENVFKNFDFQAVLKNGERNIYPFCAICLRSCISPSIPNNCSHSFCFKCLRLWSKKKNRAHYVEKISRKLLGADITRINIFKYYKSINQILLNNTIKK